MSITTLFLGLADAAQGEWACKITERTNYILQTHSFDELLARITPSLPNQPSCSSRSLSVPSSLDGPTCLVRGGHDRPGLNTLTIREQQIVHLIEQGLSNKEIAKRLILSLHTVKNHIHNLITKLDVESRHEAVRVLKVR